MRAIFLHHSVGRYILHRGGLRERLADAAPQIELWDHDYNKFGLSDARGQRQDRGWQIPRDNTDPDGFLHLFTGNDDESVAARQALETYDLVMLKSCYPNSLVTDDKALAERKNLYKNLLDAMTTTTVKQFVLLTSPPLAFLRTPPSAAHRTRKLNKWLTDQTSERVSIFDLFDVLAGTPTHGSTDRLRWTYQRKLLIDAHPNTAGCIAAASALADHLAHLMAEEAH